MGIISRYCKSLRRKNQIIVDTKIEDDFKITSIELEKHVTKNTKWFILNSPGNPTGSVYSKEDLEKISKVLTKYSHINILSDDIYEHIIYNSKKFYNIINVNPSLKDRTFLVNGVSKVLFHDWLENWLWGG